MAFACLTLAGLSPALGANSGVSYQGRILKPNSAPLEDSSVQFRLQIRAPDSSNCLFYEEAQTLNMSDSNGSFALTINDGTGSRLDSTGYGLDRIFSNSGTFTFLPSLCTTGSTYSPNEGDGRNLVVLFKDSSMSTWEPIPAQKINFVPFAFEAKQVQGFAAANILRFAESNGTLVNTSPLNNAQYTELLALLAGTSTQFERAGRLGGASLPALGAGQAGQLLSWTGTGWATSAPSTTVGADSVASANIVNGTITGADLATNIAITTTSNFVTSGTVTSNISTARDFRIYDSDANPNENYISLKAPASLPSNFEYTWPANFGTATHVLTTDGLGGLTWSAPASSSQWVNGPSNAIGYTAGAVGIGTTTPTSGYGLEVAGNVALWRVVGSNGVAGTPTFMTGSSNGLFSPNSGADLGFSTNGTEKMRILAGGQVGIGMTAPSARLNIAAGTATAGTAPLKFTPGVLLGTEEDGAMEYTSAGLWFTIGSIRYLIPMNTTAGNYSSVSTISNAGGSITMTPSSGNSLIVNQSTVSTSSSTGALVVNGGVGVAGAINAAGNITSGGSVSATNSMITPQIYGSSAASGNIRIDGTSDATKGNVLLASTGGRVGIGTTSPSTALEVNGDISSTSLTAGSVTSTGTIAANVVTARDFRAYDLDASPNENFISIKAPASLPSNFTYTWPSSYGSASQVLTSDGLGGLSWAATSPSQWVNGPSNAIGYMAGNVGIGTTTPSAYLHLAAGTATTAPLKFTAGTNRTSPQDGEMEYDGAGLWFTIGTTRHSIPTNALAGNFSNVQTIANPSGSITMTPSAGNSVIVNQSTVSTSSTTGALIVNGGVGTAGAVNSAGNITSGGSVTATNSMITPQIYGSTTASGDIRIDGTSNATKGNVILASAGGHVAIGSTAPVYNVTAGRTLLSIKGSTGAGVLELATGQADATDVVIGSQQYSDVNATSTDKRAAYIVSRLDGATANNRGGSLAFGTKPNNGTAPAERIRIDSAGYVGIATSTPTTTLDVNGIGKIGLGTGSTDQSSILTLNGERPWIFEQGGSGATASVNFRPSVDLKSFKIISMDRSQTALNVFTSNNGPSNAVYLVPGGGAVGIGTTNPGYKLDVAGSLNASALYVGGVAVTGGGDFLKDGSVTMTGPLKLASGAAGAPGLAFGAESTLGIYRAASGQIGFSVGSNQVLRIFGGTNTDAYISSGKSRFTTGNAASPTYGFENDTSSGIFGGSGTIGFSIGGVARAQIDASGVFGPTSDNTYALGTSSNRFTNIYATGSIISTSDGRAKTNIKDSDLGLDFINSLRPVSYHWKSGDKQLHYGLIAQETEKAIQDAKAKNGSGRNIANVIVDHDAKTDRYGVKYTELISPMIKAIQELYSSLFSTNQEVAKLKEENEAQARELKEMRARLEKLERAIEAKN